MPLSMEVKMANALVHQTEVLDAINCVTAAEVMAAIEQMGMSLDLACPIRISLIEETLTDGSKAQSIAIRAEDDPVLDAAAPELLQALKRTLKFIRLGNHRTAHDMLAQAEAAIAKAEGR